MAAHREEEEEETAKYTAGKAGGKAHLCSLFLKGTDRKKAFLCFFAKGYKTDLERESGHWRTVLFMSTPEFLFRPLPPPRAI